MATIANNLQLVRNRIEAACAQLGRAADSVTLLAVSKMFQSVTVRDAFHAGQRCFGENYVQEAIDKMVELADLRAQITWHLIGPLQSNKTRVVAEHFDWVQSVDRLKIAQRLSEQRPAHLPPLQVCIQVNTSGEGSKSGVAPSDALTLAQAVAVLPRLQLRGVMALPAPSPDPAVQAEALAQVRVVFEQLRAAGLPLDVLSMGMSADLEAAVAQGSTMVRVGTALFGQR
ncbi:MAG: YggS family pyridoxal phosphate-dependent enzyme [Aquabacterium sp.]|jgi:pyridoxal phosphate enzyme (YggS family)|uniref:YggS family pyridoxal phosphate-dependent enzyme n=1 Tax=Aquabacterium sp. TaxID=1872578 RepID=UPI001B4F4E4D|nr:YggS family pyridoxal phosphate-dependent enzyme [Aquabacterium sp.]MBP7131501.1 YggS family pyridoxal phosphate-dependent enzyme [Aquabacterium sp.]MDQ5925747.1 Pyridoxal phosphate homeostasis protein [Pseudomonadota bacterium]